MQHQQGPSTLTTTAGPHAGTATPAAGSTSPGATATRTPPSSITTMPISASPPGSTVVSPTAGAGDRGATSNGGGSSSRSAPASASASHPDRENRQPSRASSTGNNSDIAPPPAENQVKLGVCAMDRKARSKPMRNILSRLLATGKFEIIVFGDKCIIDEDVENWPLCDFLISFHSDGFPLDKAIRYVELRKPVCINDLPMQQIFWDRRVVLAMLDRVGVRTPPRIEVDRDGGPKIDKSVADQIQREMGIRVDTPRPDTVDFKYDEDKVEANGKVVKKSYVEKPVDGEDHNINIYFSKKRGGGGRRLFRKIGNKSSELDPELNYPRMDGRSYVYEQFMDVENLEDIKAYTLGPHFVHAETRKSPAVDGVVRRNTDGKELRYVTELTEEEKEMASKIATAFKQNICGFDLLRANGKSYVIDVNGWSFVKGNDFYYDKCAEILERFCTNQVAIPKTPTAKGDQSKKDKSWALKGAVCVFRHADRTPKMKLKFNIKGSWTWSKPFIDLLQGRQDEIILRADEQLQYIADAADTALCMEGCDEDMLRSLKKILEKKIGIAGTKAQLKPSFSTDAEGNSFCEKLNIIVKWGGEFTHAGRYQSRDLGENMRKDYAILNKTLLNNVSISSSSERRAIATAEIFGSAILNNTAPANEGSPHRLIIRKDLLDDSNAAKEPMDKVKKRLKVLLRPGEYKRPEFAFAWRVPDVEPQQVVQETVELLRYHRAVMRENWEKMDVEEIQSRWCCAEYPALWRERWDKIFVEFCDVEPEKFDPSRISELYDSIKYDALHNQVFLETIFTPISQHQSDSPDKAVSTSKPPKKLKELYNNAKILFDYIAPAEYGIEKAEKLEIGVLTSWPLLNQILEDLVKARDSSSDGRASFYFTKESHIQTLVNLVLLSDLPIVMPQLPELDYMSYITFELYERIKGERKEFSIRIALSEGAHSLPLDASLDAKHALSVQPRRVLTNHIPLDDAYKTLHHYAESSLYKKSSSTFEGMLPVEGDELFTGTKHELVQVIDMDFSRAPRPRSVTSTRDGTASETNSVIMG